MVIATKRNITESKQAEAEIAKLAKFPNENPNPVTRVAQNGTILYANKAALPLLNKWKCQVGQPLPEHWHKIISAVLRSGSKKEAEINVGQQTISVTFSPVASKDYVNLYGLDITERKQTEQALQESEAKYKTLVEDAPIGIYFSDLGGTFLYGNKKAEEIIGYKREELLSKSFLKLKLLDPKELAKAIKLLALNKLGKATGPDRFVLNSKDGTKSIVEIHTRITTVGGKKVVLGMVEDITERKKAKEALQAEKNKLQSVIDAMADGLSIHDKDFNIIYQNEPSRIGAGRDCAGERCYRAYEGRDKVCDGCPVEKAFKDGQSHTADRTHVMPSGEVTFWENTASPIRGTKGNIVSCLEITRDITERKKTGQALADEATRRRILIDQSRDGIVVLDQNGKVYEANQRFAEMLGYTPEEAAELHVWDWEFVFPHEQVLEMIRSVDEAGDHFETQHRRKDGTIYDVEISTNGAVCAGQKLIFCVCRDITERKQAEEALKESEQYLKTLFDATTGGILVVDPETHQIVDANPATSQMIGVPRGQIIGNVCHQFVCPAEVGKCPITDLKQKIDTSERVILNAKGERIPILKSVVPITRQGRQYLLELVVDITERKRLEQEREQLLRNLEDKTKELEQIIYVTSHDLRSPLVNIQGFTRELEQSLKEVRSATQGWDIPPTVAEKLDIPMDEDIPTALKYILASTSKIDLLLSGLLRLSRLGCAALAVKNLDMNELMADVIHAFEFNIKEAEVTLEAEGLPSCRGDNTQINQVFSNLIDNALKFLDPSRPGIIRVSGRKEDGQVIFCVEDNGIGIAPEHYGKVFEIFQRLDPGASSGEGLGLTIVRRILDRHSGKIWLESESGKGSKFFVSLPAA